MQPWQEAVLMMAEDGPLARLKRAVAKAKASAAAV